MARERKRKRVDLREIVRRSVAAVKRQHVEA